MIPTVEKAVDCCSEKYHGYLMPHAWTLCLGAGISKGIVPDWFDLTFSVLSECVDSPPTRAEFVKLVEETGWSLDSWIQVAANSYFKIGKSEDDFKALLEASLYSVLRDKAKGLGLEKHLTTVLNYPDREPKDRIIEILDFIESEFAGCSLIQVGNALIEAAKANKPPKAVLTFNADTLLETYIVLKLRGDHYRGPGPYSHPSYPFVQITRPSNSSGDRTPIIHCHGSVSPLPRDGVRHRDSRDRLIFLEQEYLGMGASGAPWSETTFLYYAQTTRIAFAGLSMSDANIRRWMSACRTEKERDESAYGFEGRKNPDHIWIKPKPSFGAEMFVSSMAHLGIRPAWIDSWGRLQEGLLHLGAVRRAT